MCLTTHVDTGNLNRFTIPDKCATIQIFRPFCKKRVTWDLPEGLCAVVEKAKQFAGMIEENHCLSITNPIIIGKYFSIGMTLDVTMKGRGRTSLEEICVYKVEEGKIVLELFFY